MGEFRQPSPMLPWVMSGTLACIQALTSNVEQLQAAVTDLNNAVFWHWKCAIVDLPCGCGSTGQPSCSHRLRHIIQMFSVDHAAGCSNTLTVRHAYILGLVSGVSAPGLGSRKRNLKSSGPVNICTPDRILLGNVWLISIYHESSTLPVSLSWSVSCIAHDRTNTVVFSWL